MKILCFIILILLLPVYSVIALLIFIQTKGSVMFKQKRVGFLQKEFIIYKFKTMEDNKITPLGKVIRKLGLDELPQLINIIKGEMAFVGPRPLTLFDIERLGWNIEEYNKRWSVKPGITGLAQLSKICDANLSIKNDLLYIEEKNIWLDIKIFIKSMIVPIVGKLTK